MSRRMNLNKSIKTYEQLLVCICSYVKKSELRKLKTSDDILHYFENVICDVWSSLTNYHIQRVYQEIAPDQYERWKSLCCSDETINSYAGETIYSHLAEDVPRKFCF
jgi:hypothetical protein